MHKVEYFRIAMLKNNVVPIPDLYYRTEEGKHVSEGQLTQFARNLDAYGFAPSKSLLEEFAKMEQKFAMEIMGKVLSAARKLVGKPNYPVFYQSFPMEVAIRSEDELYLNAIKHYVFGYVPNEGVEFRIDEEWETVREGVRVLKPVGQHYYSELLRNILASPIALSNDDRSIVELLIPNLGRQQVKEGLETPIPFKETMAMVVSLLHETNQLDFVDTTFFVKTATDVLRVIAYGSTGSTVIHDRMPLILKNKERKLVVKLLNNVPNLVEDMLRNKLHWRDVAKLLHVNAKKYPKIADAFDYVFDKKKSVSYNSQVEKSLETYLETEEKTALIDLLELLAKRPGEFTRRLDMLLRKAKKSNHVFTVLSYFGKIAPDVSSRVLLQLKTHFLNRNNANVPRIVSVQSSMVELDKTESLDEDVVKDVLSVIDQALRTIYSKREDLGKVYVEEGWKDIVVSTSERKSNQSLNTLTSGSRKKYDSDKEILRTFVFWENANNGEDRVDIDSSATFYDSNFEEVSHCTYYQLKAYTEKAGEYIALHSGDIINAPKGAAEYVDIDLKIAKKNAVRYVLFQIHSYTQQTFDELGTVRAGFLHMDKKDVQKKELYNAKYVANSTMLNTPNTNSLICIFDLETNEMIWVDTAAKHVQTLSNNAYHTERSYESLIRRYADGVFPNMFDLLVANVEARGELVTEIPDDFTDITVLHAPSNEHPFDLNKINAEFV